MKLHPMIIGAILVSTVGCAVSKARVSPAPSELTAKTWSCSFALIDGSESSRAVNVTALVENPSKKHYEQIKLHVTVTWEDPPAKVEGDFVDWPILSYGGFIGDVLPAGRFCYANRLILPISDDLWRLNFKVDVKLVSAKEYVPSEHPNSELNWQLAALSGTKDDLEGLLDAEPRLTSKLNKQGYSLMFLAIASGDLEKVKLLEEKGLPLDDIVSEGRLATHMAAFGSPEMVKYIFGKKLPVNVDNYGNLPLAYGIYNGRLDTTKALIEAGQSVDLTDSSGNNAFMKAIEAFRPEFVDYFGQEGVKTNVFNDVEQSPLSYAMTRTMDLDLLDLVYKYDKNVNASGPRYKSTPLHHAVGTGRYQTAAWLLAHGADKSMKDSLGKTPEEYLYLVSNEMDRWRMQAALNR